MKKSKKVLSLVLCIAFAMAFSLGFTTNAVEIIEIPEIEENMAQPRMACNYCNTGMTILVCTGQLVGSERTTHKTGFLGIGGETCTVTSYRSVYEHTCMDCLRVVETVYGHYCDILHTICEDESHCRHGEIA